MSGTNGLTPIPWRFVDEESAPMWIWSTPHFEVKIMAEMNSMAWEIGDLVVSNEGAPRFLAEGRARDFAVAEAEVREAIGKSYPAHYGYRTYAGALATTFTLATGARRDLSAFHGQRVVVTVRLSGGEEQRLIGQCAIIHYELALTLDTGRQVLIQPAHVQDIVGEYGATGATRGGSTYTGVGRIHKGTVTAHCTGVPGYLPDTIDHQANTCPVHEDTGPQFALAPRV